MFYDTEQFKLPCPLRPARDMEDDLGELYLLVAYFRDLQKRSIHFKFYRQNELDTESSSDEMDYSVTTVAVEKSTLRAAPAPVAAATTCRPVPLAAPSCQPAVPHPPSNELVPAAAHVAVAAATTSLPAVEHPPSGTAAASRPAQLQPPADEPTPAVQQLPADELIPATPSALPAATLNVLDTVPASNEQPATKVKPARGRPRKSENADKNSNKRKRDATVAAAGTPRPYEQHPPPDECRPGATPASAPDSTPVVPVIAQAPTEQPVAKVKQSRKRKHDAAAGPSFEKDLRARDRKPADEVALRAEPSKKRRKVKWWRKTGMEREVPWGEASDWESADEVTQTPDKDNQHADNNGNTSSRDDDAGSLNTGGSSNTGGSLKTGGSSNTIGSLNTGLSLNIVGSENTGRSLNTGGSLKTGGSSNTIGSSNTGGYLNTGGS